MAYNIGLRTYQTNTNAFFRPVEYTNWGNLPDNWYINNNNNGSDNTLHMNNSGTSGGIRFISDATNEQFIVFVGVHNYVRWCDIVADPGAGKTATALNPVYYQAGTPQAAARERTSASCSATNSRGRAINLTYTVATGNALSANIVIG